MVSKHSRHDFLGNVGRGTLLARLRDGVPLKTLVAASALAEGFQASVVGEAIRSQPACWFCGTEVDFRNGKTA